MRTIGTERHKATEWMTPRDVTPPVTKTKNNRPHNVEDQGLALRC